MNMTKIIRMGLMAVMVSFFVPAFADGTDEEEEPTEGAIGWTIAAVSLASPVQIPWGVAKWDVFGVDLGLFYNDAPKMYGLQLGMANTVREELRGASGSFVFNYTYKDVYGFRGTFGGNISNGTVYGVDFGGFGYNRAIYGAELAFVATVQQNLYGAAASLIGNVTENECYGITVGGSNLAQSVYGAQVALALNMTDKLNGCQIGLINFARECPWGFQIGLINIILDNQIKVLPIVNGYF